MTQTASSSTVTTALAVVAAFLAVVAAIRSTWSPCGVSMLSTVTPLAERARGHRYGTTAAWFVAGATCGGACLGLVMAGLAAAVHGARWSGSVVALCAVGAAAFAAASDARIGGFRLPAHDRQVNERWLDQFRSWVYGAGFGWQIGAGLATYIKTAAVYLMIVLAALTGDPMVALVVGLLFGLVRGLAVFLGRGISSMEALTRFHHRFAELDPSAAAGALTAELAVGALFVGLLSPWLLLAVVVVAVVVVAMVIVAGRIVAGRFRPDAPRPRDPVTPSGPTPAGSSPTAW